MISLHFCIPKKTENIDELRIKAKSFSHIPYEKNSDYLEKILSKKNLPSVSESLAALEALDFLLKKEQTLEKDENGRPHIIGNETIDFSLSHTSELSACAIIENGKAPRVGLDTEKIYKDDPTALVNRFFSSGEKAYYNISRDKKSTFTLLWTRKEAYLKYMGTGLSTPLSSFDVTSLMGVRFESFIKDGKLITVCAKEKDFPLIII